MHLEGSCHCGLVRFTLESKEPWPYQRCYCSICRKTGSGGFMINLGADAESLVVQGEENVAVYRANIGEGRLSKHGRHFCRECGCHLWAHSERWPDLVHPVASAIDTPLPKPPRYVHMMVGSKAPWVVVESQEGDLTFDDYPEQSLAGFHDAGGYDDAALE